MIELNKISQLNTFLVGGAVRDHLLDYDIIERDYLVIGATPEQMTSLGFIAVGKDFPVFLHPKTKEEYALARTEKKQGKGYKGFVCYTSPEVTIEQDLLRRDLTINAMAMDNEGNIIDPYHGKKDIEARVLRHVSPAFIEDPLRVLRVARFTARYHDFNFTIADETLSLMKKITASGELNELSSERIWKEMDRSLNDPHPEIFFEVLKECGVLKAIWPELDALWGVPNPKLWHPEICTGVHTMMVLKQAVLLSNKPEVRFAALCHDLGKSLTLAEKLPSHPGHEKAGLPLVEKICAQLRIPNHYKKLALKVCEHHLHCHKAFQLKPSTLLRIFNQLDIWRQKEEFFDFITACKADFRGRLNFENKEYPQEQYLIDCANAAKAVTAKPFVEQGLKGKAIKEAMEREKLHAIAQIKEQYKFD